MFLQQLINGLTLGSVYALISLGYTMVYGILQLINFAHGEIYMIGAYMAIIVLGVLTATGLTATSLSLSILLVFVISGLFCGAYGLTMERVAYRPLRHAHRLSPLISAIGMSIFLQNYVILTQGTVDKVFPHIIPSTGIEISGASISYLQVLILATSFILMTALHLFIKKTRLGKAMRTTAATGTTGVPGATGNTSNMAATGIIGSILAA